jgi:hypothetical protein
MIASRTTKRCACALTVTLLGLFWAPARAQTPAPAEKMRPDTSTQPGSLSDKLDRSDGVIKPPAGVDPRIAKPAPEPDPNSTVVIPPPGSPGGRQDVEPK